MCTYRDKQCHAYFKHPGLEGVHNQTPCFFDQTVVFFLYNLISEFLSARGRGRGRSRNDEEEEGAGGRPSGPSTLFDFLESKMGVFSIDGG